MRNPIQLYNSLFSVNPTTTLFSNIRWHPKTQILPLPLPPWITTTASISLCLSIVAQSSPSYSRSANYFEVIKTCFLLCIISIYCSLSLSIRFNCWNFVSLWLWVALDLSFFCFCFHGILLVCGYGLSRFNFFCFLFFFLCKFPRFLLLPFVVKSMAKKNHEIFVIRFSFSLFFCFCNFYWIFGFL